MCRIVLRYILGITILVSILVSKELTVVIFDLLVICDTMLYIIY